MMSDEETAPASVMRTGEEEQPSISSESAGLMGNDGFFAAGTSSQLPFQKTKELSFWKLLVYVVLILVAVFVGGFVYFALSQSEEKDFETKSREVANQIIETVEHSTEESLSVLSSLSNQLTSYALGTNSSFPFVTLPNFDIRSTLVHEEEATTTDLIMFAPLVKRALRAEWEAYSVQHQGWIQEDLLLRGLKNAKSGEISDEIYSFKEASSNDDGDPDFSAPIWQVGPVPTDSSIVNLDLYSHPSFRRMIYDVLDVNHILLSEVTDVDFLTRHVGSIDGGRDEHPRSYAIQPVYDGFGVGAEIAGFLIAVVAWDSFMAGIHDHHDIEGFDVHFADSCGSEFSYHLGDDKLNYSGKKKSSDLEYEHLRQTTDFAQFAAFDGLHDENSFIVHCSYRISVSPTEEFKAQFESGDPILFTAISVVLCIFIAILFALYDCTTARLAKLSNAAEAEKMSLQIDNSKKIAERERELNDWIAHEVRNPLSAALGACSFLSSELHKAEPLQDEVSRQTVREDVGTIDKSLQFINELLRSMLDCNMVTSRQLKMELAPTDLLRDILEPTAAMLYNRSENFEILLECPENLVVMTDGLRLKQITLNLSRNSAKFVQKGFVKFKVVVIDESVSIYIEDSGPGIPASKHDKLFAKFQESLDSLNQGTGVGLSLCKSLADLLGGELFLDQDFESGIEGCPGTRFVIDLKRPPLSQDMVAQYAAESLGSEGNSGDWSNSSACLRDEELAITTNSAQIPDEMRVLFVDDDMMLRKLFRRSVQKTFPKWHVEEASHGETALQLVESCAFDLIFLDQFMASTERTLLGTETARALRAKNCQSIICGLSANDLERQFLAAGANCFCLKPFPCKSEALRSELTRILLSPREGSTIPIPSETTIRNGTTPLKIGPPSASGTLSSEETSSSCSANDGQSQATS